MKVGYQALADLQQQQAFKQWGFTLFEPVDYKNINFTLPLAVNGTFCAFSTGYDVKGTTFLWHSMSHFNNINVGVTGFVFDSRYTFTGLGYLAICWQKQWGIISNNKAAFPIAFTAFCSAATLFSRGSGAGTWYGENAYVTLTGISCVTPDYVLNGNFIAIGA